MARVFLARSARDALAELDFLRADAVLDALGELERDGNPDFWLAHFADEGIVALPFGLLDKDATVQAMKQATPWARVDMADLCVMPLGDASVLVAYRASARRFDDEEEDFEAVVGSVYIRRDGAWQLAFHQQSFTAGT